MAKFEARVRTRFGELVINFDSIDELKTNLNTLDTAAVSDLLSKEFASVIVKKLRQPKPGFEGIYRFAPSGMVEPITVPQSKAETVALVLFAYHPEEVSVEQLALSTGVENVSDYLANKSYTKFWSKSQDGKCLLSQEGIEWVVQKIAPNLKETTEPKSSDKTE